MPTLNLTRGFKKVSEGEHIFKVVEVNYDEEYGKMKIDLVTSDGQTHRETFSLLGRDGKTPNDSAYAAFSFTARTLMGSNDIDEIDTDDLIGHYMLANVVWKKYAKSDGSEAVAANLENKRHADGFGEGATETQTATDPYSELDGLLD